MLQGIAARAAHRPERMVPFACVTMPFAGERRGHCHHAEGVLPCGKIVSKLEPVSGACHPSTECLHNILSSAACVTMPFAGERRCHCQRPQGVLPCDKIVSKLQPPRTISIWCARVQLQNQPWCKRKAEHCSC